MACPMRPWRSDREASSSVLRSARVHLASETALATWQGRRGGDHATEVGDRRLNHLSIHHPQPEPSVAMWKTLNV